MRMLVAAVVVVTAAVSVSMAKRFENTPPPPQHTHYHLPTHTTAHHLSNTPPSPLQPHHYTTSPNHTLHLSQHCLLPPPSFTLLSHPPTSFPPTPSHFSPTHPLPFFSPLSPLHTSPSSISSILLSSPTISRPYFFPPTPTLTTTGVCIAEFESTFNTEAINTINWDGSYDYGLFQLNNKYWCKDDNKKGKNVCKMACTDLLDADLTDDLNCIKKIIKDTERWKGRGTGLTAWVAYQNKCKDRNLGDYISECWSGSTSSNIVSIRDESTIKNPAAQVTENADTAGVGAGGRINAMMAALNGLMPMLGYACYSPIYYNTVDVLPAAQFFFAAGLNAIIIVLFIIIQVRQSSPISPEDLEVAPEKEDKDGPGNSKTLTLSSPGKSRDSHKCNDSPTLQQLSYAKKNTKELTSSLPPVPSECYSVGDCATRHMVQNRSEGSGMLQQQLQLTCVMLSFFIFC
ncbi:Lysozyme C-like [Homarus americanus]|uniref:lysozyme n=1 Tax=Homarus americanus TaxID=6706 RepID=A0A8J5JYS3_HOMAM|nr:Lysozyme C-like [Homarus americanus]